MIDQDACLLEQKTMPKQDPRHSLSPDPRPCSGLQEPRHTTHTFPLHSAAAIATATRGVALAHAQHTSRHTQPTPTCPLAEPFRVDR